MPMAAALGIRFELKVSGDAVNDSRDSPTPSVNAGR